MNFFKDAKYNEMYKTLQSCLDPKQTAFIEYKLLETIASDTKHPKGIRYFWQISEKIDIENNPMLTWKFCVVLHQIILNGNENFLKGITNEMEKLIKINTIKQTQLNPCYGPLNKEYIQFIMAKIDFCKRNEIFPSSFELTIQEILVAAKNEINYLFKAFKEIVGYMEHILSFYRAIQSSLVSIPTGTGLRLLPLTFLISEANKLYQILKDLISYMHQIQPYHSLEYQRFQFSKIHAELYALYVFVKVQTDKMSGLFYNIPVFTEICPNFTHFMQQPQQQFVSNDLPPSYSDIMVNQPHQHGLTATITAYPSQPTYPTQIASTISAVPAIDSSCVAYPAHQPMPNAAPLYVAQAENSMYPQLPTYEPTASPMASAPPLPEKSGYQ